MSARCWYLALMLLPGIYPPAVAADEEYRFELTPYAAYRMGGSFSDEASGVDFDIEDSAA